MIKTLTYILFSSLFLMVVTPVKAEITKDSFYFMKDDGEFSDEEKDEEAAYIYEVCETNVFQRTYYNCECIAGAFRQERDKEKLIPQNTLLNSLYSENKKDCTNKTAIAGEAYQFCQHFAKTYRNREKNNQQYCECVARKVAKDFATRPILRAGYIGGLKTDALVSCRRQER